MPRRSSDSSSGQASVAFIATVPAVLGALVLLGQLALVGYTAWSAAGSARAVARAELVGADPEAAARAALPGPVHRGELSVDAGLGGPARVELVVPRLLPFLPRLEVAASASLDPEGAGG